MNEYKDERDILEKDIKALEGKSATYSGVRFVMFLAALAGLIIGIYDNRVTVNNSRCGICRNGVYPRKA